VRVLLDENMPVDFAPELPGHEVATVQQLGWDGLKNGELLRNAAGRFDALITMDQNLPFQQNLTALPLGVLLLSAPSNRLHHLRPLAPAILIALADLHQGELRRVGA
jgi:hypothetical protein